MGAHEVILMDGGTGTELRERGVEVPCHRSSIWSARALLEAPDEVVAVHREYIDAGARVVTACNYAVTPTLLAREGMEHMVEELSVLAVDLATFTFALAPGSRARNSTSGTCIFAVRALGKMLRKVSGGFSWPLSKVTFRRRPTLRACTRTAGAWRRT